MSNNLLKLKHINFDFQKPILVTKSKLIKNKNFRLQKNYLKKLHFSRCVKGINFKNISLNSLKSYMLYLVKKTANL